MRVIAKSLYGSNNYHLDSSNSDKDYKVFFAPEFIDLYNCKDKPSLPIGYDHENYSAMDIRKLDSLLHKGNVNAIEYIFSSDLQIYDNKFKNYFELVQDAFKRGYLAYVWKGYFSALKGIVMNSLVRYDNNDYNKRKAMARGAWWINFTSYIVKHDYRITKSMWENPLIYKFARELRFDEDYMSSYNWEDWDKMFQYIEVLAANTQCSVSSLILHDCDNEMTRCLQNILADVIKEELEKKYD